MARGLILAHHDRHGIVDDHVVAAIHAYRAVADYLVVVSTSARALPDTVAPLVDRFIPRPNEGYDFCSWRAGIGAQFAAGECRFRRDVPFDPGSGGRLRSATARAVMVSHLPTAGSRK
jgi:hypothetical protein